ncbi:MAG: isopentenyl phosphate kinase [Thermoplasmata archaeon]
MQIIKLGGSVITDKRRYRRFKGKTTWKILGEIAGVQREKKVCDIMIVHGAGSFGHIKAKQYSLDAGKNEDVNKQAEGFAKVHYDVRSLNLKIMEMLYKLKLPAVSIPPLCVALNSNGKLKSLAMERFRDAMENGLVPVTFGDVVFDEEKCFSICSGDDLALKLAEIFDAERVIFLCDIPGIYEKFPPDKTTKILSEITPELIADLKARVPAFDVTGGIFGKVQKSFEFLINTGKKLEIWIISGRDNISIRNALIGNDIRGTKVVIK